MFTGVCVTAHTGGLDFQAYKSEIEQMLLKGQLAVQIHAAEQTIEMADGSEQLLYLADSWAVMDELVPFKVQRGSLSPSSPLPCQTKTCPCCRSVGF